MKAGSLTAVALIVVLALGCIGGDKGVVVNVPSSDADGRLLRCLHENGAARETCLIYLAAADKNSGHCLRINDNAKRNLCKSAVLGDVSLCLGSLNETTEAARRFCTALYNKKPEDCASIEDDKTAGECATLASFVNYEKEGCGTIKDEKQKAECITHFAVNSRDHLMCLLVGGESRDDCFMDYAIAYASKEFCSKIADENKKTLCDEQEKVRETTLADCLTTQDEGKKTWCINAVAADRLDESFCRLHASEKNKLACENIVLPLK